jgi:flagellar basal-body rod protein FlgG
MRAMNIAATGMSAQQTNVEVIANNIANQSTTGFKRQRAEFQDLLYQTERRGGATSSDAGTIVPIGVQVGLGVKTAAINRINIQGNLIQTGNPLDLAVQGRGFFQILQPDGTTAYTRDGSFALSPTGEIVTSDGFVVHPGITIPQNTIAIAINSSGQVQAQVAGQVTPQTVGQLQLANFPNEAGLEALGNNLLLETPASGQATTGNPGAIGFGTINQAMIETSNVDIVSEITSLITAQRAYEMNSKVISSTDQMMQTLNQIQ